MSFKNIKKVATYYKNKYFDLTPSSPKEDIEFDDFLTKTSIKIYKIFKIKREQVNILKKQIDVSDDSYNKYYFANKENDFLQEKFNDQEMFSSFVKKEYLKDKFATPQDVAVKYIDYISTLYQPEEDQEYTTEKFKL